MEQIECDHSHCEITEVEYIPLNHHNLLKQLTLVKGLKELGYFTQWLDYVPQYHTDCIEQKNGAKDQIDEHI